MNDNFNILAYRGFEISISCRRLRWEYLFVDDDARYQIEGNFPDRDSAVRAVKAAIDHNLSI